MPYYTSCCTITFNGAATCSLRKVGSYPWLVVLMSFLQWGRNLFVAESKNVKTDFVSIAQPSMGPQLVRCGKSCCWRCGRPSQGTLQWGRNLFVAESAGRQVNRQGHDTFNGAATCSLRKVACVILSNLQSLYLQWGRNLFVAESLMAQLQPPMPTYPSMGPQLVRCGKVENQIDNVNAL